MGRERFSMTAIKDEAIGYINAMPEEKMISAISFLRKLQGAKHPLEITSKKELYKKLDKGMDDIKNGRVYPFDEVMDEIMDDLQKRIDGV
jgi:hypothetical protein